MTARAWLIGRVSSMIHDIQPAQQIVDEMVNGAAALLQQGASMVQVKGKAKL